MANITDLDIYGATLIARHETAGPVTNAIFNTAKGALTDADIIYSVASSNLTISGSNDLLIWTGDTYAPGGNITIPGSFINEGTFTPATHTVTLTATDTDNIITSAGASFNNLTINGSGGVWTLQDAMDVNTDLTITAGTLDLNGSNLDLTGGTFSNDGTLKLIGSETVTIPTMDTDSGTVEYYGTGTYATGLVAGDNYYNLTFSGAGTYTLDAALDVNNNLTFTTSTSNITSGGVLFETRDIITINSDYVNDNLTNFPVLFSVTDTDLINNVMSGSNYTIKFTNASGTELAYEVEYYDNTTGQLIAWVKADSLSSATDTNLYFYYGSSGTASTEGATAVWDANYAGVWHLSEDPSGGAPQMLDSTSNNNDGTSAGSMTTGDQVAGQIDGSLDFDGVDDYVETSSTSFPTGTGARSLELWFKAANLSGNIVLAGYGGQAANNTFYLVYIGSTQKLYVGNIGGGDTPGTSQTISTNVWYHAVITYDGNIAKIYLNGYEEGSAVRSFSTTLTNFGIGQMIPPIANHYFNGLIDEVAIYNRALSAEEVKDRYNQGRGRELPAPSTSQTYESQVMDLGASYKGDLLAVQADVPNTTTLSCRVRVGTSSTPDAASWDVSGTNWTKGTTATAATVGISPQIFLVDVGTLVGATSWRYWQYRLDGTTDGSNTWVARDVMLIPQPTGFGRLKDITTTATNVQNCAENRYYQWLALGATDGSAGWDMDKITLTYYPNTNPWVVNNTGAPFGVVNSFTETLGGGNEGSVAYQLSPNAST
ncbi:MAG: DUF2341 domain-containing protein, partial [Candidatus Omnitrophica bacterium]|nr:DUF2341 domain-containing protein [Candidatus Omnitrophota bacterium]